MYESRIEIYFFCKCVSKLFLSTRLINFMLECRIRSIKKKTIATGRSAPLSMEYVFFWILSDVVHIMNEIM